MRRLIDVFMRPVFAFLAVLLVCTLFIVLVSTRASVLPEFENSSEDAISNGELAGDADAYIEIANIVNYGGSHKHPSSQADTVVSGCSSDSDCVNKYGDIGMPEPKSTGSELLFGAGKAFCSTDTECFNLYGDLDEKIFKPVDDPEYTESLE